MKKLDMNDILVVAGGGLAAFGIWLIYPPAAYIIAGLILVKLGLPPRSR